MVDFLEGHVPGVLTGVVQLLVSIAVLFSFDRRLGLAALGALAAIVSGLRAIPRAASTD